MRLKCLEPLVHVTEPLEKCLEPLAPCVNLLFRSHEGGRVACAPESISVKYFVYNFSSDMRFKKFKRFKRYGGEWW